MVDLDAANIIDADVSICTSVDLDHIEYLGDNGRGYWLGKSAYFSF